jgi:hypothetical protein
MDIEGKLSGYIEHRLTRDSAIGIDALIRLLFEVFELDPAGLVGQTKLLQYHQDLGGIGNLI